MRSTDIEARLRLAAPDEPNELPPLRLPSISHLGGRVGSVRFGHAFRVTPEHRVAYFLLALLVGAAVVGAGASRLLQPNSPFGALGGPGFSIELPPGWERLDADTAATAEGDETDLIGDHVVLSASSAAIQGCPTAGPSAPPVTEMPAGASPAVLIPPSPDPILVCRETSPLPAGSIRIVATIGQRILKLGALGEGIPDTSEPTRSAGWRELIAGRPARLRVDTSPAEPGAAETRTWDVLFPNAIDLVLRIRLEMAGPDLDAQRTVAADILGTLTFDDTQLEIDLADETEVLQATIDEIAADARENGSDYYDCFPGRPGTRSATISSGPSVKLAAPVDVTCTSSIEPSAAGVWRVRLDASWPAGSGYPAGGLRSEFFAAGDGRFIVGYSSSIDGKPATAAGEVDWLPKPTPRPSPTTASSR